MQFRSLVVAIAAVVAVTLAPTTSAMELATNATAANSTMTTAPTSNSTAKATTPTPSPSKKSGASTAAIAGGATLFAATLAFTSA